MIFYLSISDADSHALTAKWMLRVWGWGQPQTQSVSVKCGNKTLWYTLDHANCHVKTTTAKKYFQLFLFQCIWRFCAFVNLCAVKVDLRQTDCDSFSGRNSLTVFRSTCISCLYSVCESTHHLPKVLILLTDDVLYYPDSGSVQDSSGNWADICFKSEISETGNMSSLLGNERLLGLLLWLRIKRFFCQCF